MRVLFTILFTVIALGTSLGQSRAASCEDLWVERNQFYQDAGYCFKTQRAIRHFGNDGCSIQNENRLRLSAGAQRRIAQISAEERRQGCSG